MSIDKVWILGAGFSQPLGAPTLADLFSAKSETDFEVIFDEDISTHLSSPNAKPLVARHFYLKYAPNRPVRHEPQYWIDAEDYIDSLDSAAFQKKGAAAYDSMQHRIDKGGWEGITVEQMAGGARNWMAAECSAFLEASNPLSERWEPFRHWSGQLDKSDAVITFNYDRVPEILNEQCAAPFLIEPFGEAGRASLLKLHGSIDWKRDAAGAFEQTDDPLFALTASNEESAIATPGATKQGIVQGLEGLWRDAEFAIENAREIYFVGYRFPPTDSIARRRILNAISQNARNDLTIRIVLGPNIQSGDVKRLQAMLEAVLQEEADKVKAIPMYSQDFLSLYGVTKV